MSEDILDRFEDTKKILELAQENINELETSLNRIKQDTIDKAKEISEKSHASRFNEEDFKTFLKQPYVIAPSNKKDEWLVVVPKFIKFNVGWLDYSTDSFNVFRVNKFMSWLGEIPKELENKFKFRDKLPLTIFDGTMLTGKYQEEAWNRYNKHLSKREGKDRIKVKHGHEFDLIADMLNDGILPFMPKPIANEDLNESPIVTNSYPEWLVNIWNRDYVQKAWEKFLQYGALGIYWSFSAGKSVFGSILLDKIKGKKLVVVPTLMLKDQWTERINTYVKHRDDVEIITYNGFEKIRNNEYSLIIFDECHRLPANTYSRLSTIRAKYRVGLSATPYREDGRTDYIFALTGFPVGLDWNELIKAGIIEKPDIRLYIVNDKNSKIRKLQELLQIEKKTIVFCDSIDFGQRISKMFDIPFVYGQTGKKRLEIIEEADVCVVSRVGDEGMSLPKLQRVIEIDFLFGSRRQEGQRLGRIFHAEEKGEHIIIMTDDEFVNYEKRLYSIYEKGFKIEVIR